MKLFVLSLAVFYLLTWPALFGFYSNLSIELNTVFYLLIHFAFFYPFMFGGVKALQLLKLKT